MLLAEGESPRARMGVRTQIVGGRLEQVDQDQVLEQGRSGPPRYGRRRDSGPSRGGFSRDRDERGAKTQERKGYAAKGHGMGERARRWEKAGEVPEAPESRRTPFAPKSAGFKPGGAKFRGAKPFGAKGAGSKFGSSKPWQSRSSAGEGREDRPRPWKKFDGAGDSRGRMHAVERANRMLQNLADSNRAGTSLGLRSPVTANSPHVHVLLGKQVIGLNSWQRDRAEGGERPAGKKPYGKSSGFKPSGFTRLGFKSAGARSAEARSADGESRAEGARPWASKRSGFRGLAAQNPMQHVLRASRSPRLGARNRGASGPPLQVGKSPRRNAAIEKRARERGRERRAAPSHSGLRIREAVRVRRQRVAAIVRTPNMRRERAAKEVTASSQGTVGSGPRRRRPVIAIDGPAGAGKSTLAAHLARRFGFLNLETGAMYRALALKALNTQTALDDEPHWYADWATQIVLEPRPNDTNRVLLDGNDVTRRIRERDVSEAASQVSVHRGACLDGGTAARFGPAGRGGDGRPRYWHQSVSGCRVEDFSGRPG